MQDIQQLISQVPIDQVARQLGVSEDVAAEAVNAAIPALLGGLGANAQDPSGAASIAQALGQHGGYDPSGLFDVDGADAADGSKIVQHIFGSNEEAVVNQLAGAKSALGSGMLMKLLPLLAPLVMQWLASKWGQRGGAPAGGSASGGSGGGADVDFPFNKPEGGSASGGSAQPQARQEEQSSGGGLGDLLGGLLGGSGGGLGDLLGGLLGGGRR